MKERYAIYEDKTTYLLEVDHAAKVFSVGSIKGKYCPPKYKPIDKTGYRAHVLKIGANYKMESNNL